MVSRLLVLSAATLLAACGPVDSCPNGSMLDGPEGLVLTEEEHDLGWAHDDCFQCHTEATLHRLGCTPEADMERVQQRVEDEGLDSCVVCHGDNGVEP